MRFTATRSRDAVSSLNRILLAGGACGLLLCAQGQPFEAQTNTVIASVNGVFYFSQDDAGTNWIPIQANMVRFEIVTHTNTPFDSPLAIDKGSMTPPLPMSIKSKLTNAIASAKSRPQVFRAARSTSEADTTDTYTVTCPRCTNQFNMALRHTPPVLEPVR